VRRTWRDLLNGLREDVHDLVEVEATWTTRTLPLLEPLHALLGEPPDPLVDVAHADADEPGNLGCLLALTRQHHDARALGKATLDRP